MADVQLEGLSAMDCGNVPGMHTNHTTSSYLEERSVVYYKVRSHSHLA